MKKYIRSDSSIWPDPDDDEFWEEVEDEDLYDKYLSEPEEAVNKKHNLFAEPSVQGDRGDMFITNEKTGETVSVDWQEWVQDEFYMAIESTSPEEYATRYEDYVLSLFK